MTPEDLRASLHELDDAIEDHRHTGDALAEAELRSRKARALSQAEQWREGAQELHWAALLAAQAGDKAKEAEYLWGKGLLASKDPTLHDATLRALRRAAASARVSGREALAQSALQLHSELLERTGDLGEAARLELERVAGLERKGRSTDLVRVLHRHALLCYRWNRMSPDRAIQDAALRSLSQAIEVADHLSEARQALELRLDRRILRDHAWGSGQPFSGIRGELEMDGDPNPFGGEPLGAAMEALQLGDWDGGLSHATQARESALRSGDPQRYLLASLLVSEAREAQGDLAGVLEALLTCKGTLEQSQGAEAGARLKILLDALKVRWGSEATQMALSEYRQRLSH